MATHEVLPEARLVRFAVDPEARIVADLAAKLPGRGMWVIATREAVVKATTKECFARVAKANVVAAPDLADRVEAGLLARLKACLGLAARSGALITGFGPVREALRKGEIGLLVEAMDGAEDGRSKIFALAHGIGVQNAGHHVPVLGCLTAEELGLALGRSNVIHAAVRAGPLAKKLGLDMTRLAGFRGLAPESWRLPGGSNSGVDALVPQSDVA